MEGEIIVIVFIVKITKSLLVINTKWSSSLINILQVWPVFEHCDVDKTGLISINHLIQLCKEHGQVGRQINRTIDKPRKRHIDSWLTQQTQEKTYIHIERIRKDKIISKIFRMISKYFLFTSQVRNATLTFLKLSIHIIYHLLKNYLFRNLKGCCLRLTGKELVC